MGDWQTFYIKPFELYTYHPHFIEETEAQMEKKWIQVFLTLNPWLFAYCVMLWTHEWMAQGVGILEALVFHSVAVPNYFLQRENALPKMNPLPPNIHLYFWNPLHVTFQISSISYSLHIVRCWSRVWIPNNIIFICFSIQLVLTESLRAYLIYLFTPDSLLHSIL